MLRMPEALLRRLTPRKLLLASIGVAVLTILLKTLAWHVTGSVALLSDALESFVNLASALFAFMMVTLAQRPPDEEHPYGHGKAEYFSSGFEGVLILGAAVGIVWAAGARMQSPQPLQNLDLGIALAVVSSVFNGLLAWVMLRAAHEHRSIALEADARHLITDVWTSVGVVAGVAGVWLTGWLWLDALVAIGVALNIAREGISLVMRSSHALLDAALDPRLQRRIAQTLQEHTRPGVRFDHVATRRAGARRFVDLHMHVPADWTLGRAAKLRNDLELALMQAVPGLRATIQLLPADVEAHAPVRQGQEPEAS